MRRTIDSLNRSINSTSSRFESARGQLYSSTSVAALVTAILVLLGGTFHWMYINVQEFPSTLADSQIDYLSSYVSAFVIAGIELAAAVYFIRRYDLGKRSFFRPSLYVGIGGFLAYLIGEVAAGMSTLGGSVPLGRFLYYELVPADLDYGNALIILYSLFALILLVVVLLRINPLPSGRSGTANPVGYLGGLWASFITTFAALVCCGPLPGVIALSTGISSIYFATLIGAQPYLLLISIPLILIGIFMANRRAVRGCKLRVH